MISSYLVILNRLLCHRFVQSFSTYKYFIFILPDGKEVPSWTLPHGAPPPFLYSTSAPINFAGICLPALEESWSSKTPVPLRLVSVDPAHITPSTPLLDWRVPGHSVIPSMGAEELIWPHFQMTQRAQMSCGIWKPLITNICLPIVTLIWKVYTLECFNNRKALFVYFTTIIIIIIITS